MDDGKMILFGVGKKMILDKEAKKVTLYEGQFNDDLLEGIGRRVIINMENEDEPKFE